MNCRCLRDYHNTYLQTDVLLLADVFENFRSTCSKLYGLDPARYCTASGIGWDAALKMTGVELELLHDPDMHLFVEKPHGGISMISHRYAKANNPHLPEYNSDLPNSYIMYWDANSLYSWAMAQHLPTANFRWLSSEEIEALDITAVADDSDRGYILEVDLDYPSDLHELHNDYPLAPERITVSPDMYSPYQQQHFPAEVSEKLSPNLQSKTNYRVHYRNLKLYLELGMQVTKIRRALAFDQSPWLKPYIDFNIQERSVCTTDFEKAFSNS